MQTHPRTEAAVRAGCRIISPSTMGGREEARRRSCDRLLASLEDCRRKHHHMADVCCVLTCAPGACHCSMEACLNHCCTGALHACIVLPRTGALRRAVALLQVVCKHLESAAAWCLLGKVCPAEGAHHT